MMLPLLVAVGTLVAGGAALFLAFRLGKVTAENAQLDAEREKAIEAIDAGNRALVAGPSSVQNDDGFKRD